jgi:hypothetical protein
MVFRSWLGSLMVLGRPRNDGQRMGGVHTQHTQTAIERFLFFYFIAQVRCSCVCCQQLSRCLPSTLPELQL